jgi:hypothetical protein
MGMQKTITVFKLGEEEKANMAYWRAQPVSARFEQMEINRRRAFGEAATGRLSRSYEVVQLEGS